MGGGKYLLNKKIVKRDMGYEVTIRVVKNGWMIYPFGLTDIAIKMDQIEVFDDMEKMLGYLRKRLRG